jgi:hypothetical protein
MSEVKEWYLEYQILINRPGLLGDISSLLGMLRIKIDKINGVDKDRRGLLLLVRDDYQIKRVEPILHTMETIRVLKLRKPEVTDRLALRHGRYLERDKNNRKIFKFVRSEIGLLVDFLTELFKEETHKLIGIRGMPRVGKTESIVAASVSANKRWIFVSSTLLKQTVRHQLIADEYNENNIFVIDGIVSARRADERHWQLIREIMANQAVKVIEHPDIFIKYTEYSLDSFDYIIELRNEPDEEISYQTLEDHLLLGSDFYGFDT